MDATLTAGPINHAGGGDGAYVLFVARNRPLAFFVARWIFKRIESMTFESWAPTMKHHVWKHLHILTAPTGDDAAEFRDDAEEFPWDCPECDQSNDASEAECGLCLTERGPPLIPYGVSEDRRNKNIVFTPFKNVVGGQPVPITYGLVVVDEAHHVYRDVALTQCLEKMYVTRDNPQDRTLAGLGSRPGQRSSSWQY